MLHHPDKVTITCETCHALASDQHSNAEYVVSREANGELDLATSVDSEPFGGPEKVPRDDDGQRWRAWERPAPTPRWPRPLVNWQGRRRAGALAVVLGN